jgi:hypothetical protein
MYLHEDGRVELLGRPWKLEVSELMIAHTREREKYTEALKDYVKAWPSPYNVGGYSMSWVYYRKPLGYLVPAVRGARDLYYRVMVWCARTGFLATDLDGGIMSWRDFTLNIFRVHRERLTKAYAKQNERHDAGYRWGYRQGWEACFDEALRVAITGTSLLPPSRPDAWPWEKPVPNGVIADLRDKTLEGD